MASDNSTDPNDKNKRTHLLGIAGLSPLEITEFLDRADALVGNGWSKVKKTNDLRGYTQINLFYEPSTRTQSSFELAGKRLSADVINMSVSTSSVAKGETLIDTAITLNAMKPDILVIRHRCAGAAALLAQKVDCNVINAGDGSHEHPTQALLDAMTIRRHKREIAGLTVAICGDIAHSRVARSNIILLTTMGAIVRVIAPLTLMPEMVESLGVEAFTDMKAGLNGVDVIMMLRLQNERMPQALIPSLREYFTVYGLDNRKLGFAKPDALVMHPGPINRGVEIDTEIADGPQSLIREQVEMGVAMRMAILKKLIETDIIPDNQIKDH